MEIAVLGGGNGSLAAAVDLTEQGHRVRLWRRDPEVAAATPNPLTLKDHKGACPVEIALITSDNPVAVLLEDRVGRTAVRDVLHRAGVTPANADMNAGFREDELGPKNRVNAMTAIDVLALFRLLQAAPHYRPIITALDNA